MIGLVFASTYDSVASTAMLILDLSHALKWSKMSKLTLQ